MDDIVDLFEDLKISAFSKVSAINQYVTDTTIGPNRVLVDRKDDKSTTVIKDHKEEKSARSEANKTGKTPEPVKSSKDLRAFLEIKRSKSFDKTKPDEVSINKSLVQAGEKPDPVQISQKPVQNSNSALLMKDLRNTLEKKRQLQLQKAIENRINPVVEFSQQKVGELKKFHEKQEKLISEELKRQENIINEAMKAHDQDALVNHSLLLKHYQQVAERIKKNNLELEEREKERKRINAIIDSIKKDQTVFRACYQEIITLVRSCRDQQKFTPSVAESIKQLKGLPDALEEVILRCKGGQISETEAKKSAELVSELCKIRDSLKNCIESTNAKKEQQEQIQASAIEQPKEVQKEQLTRPNVTIKLQGNTLSLKIASELQNFLEAHVQSYKQLVDDPSFKQFVFDCKKAVNIPVNAISAVSPQHLLDKYHKLSSLLAGKTVEVGNKGFNPAAHPQGVAFCTDLLARKFVLQGDLMISSNPEAAFYYATIIISLWNENEVFGKLLLAHFHKECPYLIPFYPPKMEGQSQEDYYLSRGYQYTDGVIEKQDKFLKRMTGIMRFYSAILIAKPKRGQSGHPHRICWAWKWISSFLNLQPHPDITATMLQVFLEVTGSTLEACYGNQFRKLIKFICDVYLPMLQSIDSGGPVTRLESALQDYKKSGRFEHPKSQLPADFW